MDRGFRGAASSVLGRLPARPAFVLPFSPGYAVMGGSAVLIHWDLARDNRAAGFVGASRPLLVYLRLLSPTRSLIRGFFKDGYDTFLDSPRFLHALARLPLRFLRVAALMKPLMS